jgi:hypothetical protein
VRCELAPDGDGTRLVLLHNGVGGVWIGLVLPGWHVHLEGLGSLLRSQPQPFSMPRRRDTQCIYLGHYKLEGVMIDPPAGHDTDLAGLRWWRAADMPDRGRIRRQYAGSRRRRVDERAESLVWNRAWLTPN